jgi:signal peptide peptidase SppA
MAKKYKPVVASFGDVAASGGYYAAAGADTIISNPCTITGSIGVLSGWPVINRLLDKIDVTSDSIQSMPNAAWRHMELGLPEAEMEKLRAHVDQTYEQFKGVVSNGRNMDMDQVEAVAQGQVFTGAQAVRLGLVDHLGSLTYALSAAGKASLERETESHDPTRLREYLSDEVRELFDDAVNQGDKTFNATVDALKASPKYQDEPPTHEDIRKVLSKVVVTAEPKVEPVIIPHVNLANEALGVAISTAFQSEEERSPIPIDQPLVDPDNPPSKGQIIVGALLGIARSNNIPMWQFPMFCYWYAAQAVGKVGDGMRGGLLDTWFAKLLNSQQAFNDVLGNTKSTDGVAYMDTFAAGKSAWNIRMEMPPLKIFA